MTRRIMDRFINYGQDISAEQEKRWQTYGATRNPLLRQNKLRRHLGKPSGPGWFEGGWLLGNHLKVVVRRMRNL